VKRIVPKSPASANLIPEFCNLPALLTVALVMELICVVLTLVSPVRGPELGLRFVGLSIFLQWLGLCSAVVLCTARRFLRLADVAVVFMACWGLLLVVTVLLSLLAWTLVAHLDLGTPLGESRLDFVVRNVLVSAIVSLLLLRYFWERHQWEEQTRSESEAQYLALQSRIRPHFLFNSLNSISALIRLQPDQAEDLVVDLADLFRATLEERGRLVRLSEEMDVVRGYLRIEEVRLEGKLIVNWEIEDEMLEARIPKLTVQPLVENAIVHGISRLRERGLLHISVHRDGDYVVVEVDNPLPPENAPIKRGTGVAVNNIAQRIKLIYGERARLQLGPDRSELGDMYRARLRLPIVLDSGEQQ
jgi:two-component system sensor histidine kinase AlgZ